MALGVTCGHLVLWSAFVATAVYLLPNADALVSKQPGVQSALYNIPVGDAQDFCASLAERGYYNVSSSRGASPGSGKLTGGAAALERGILSKLGQYRVLPAQTAPITCVTNPPPASTPPPPLATTSANPSTTVGPQTSTGPPTTASPYTSTIVTSTTTQAPVTTQTPMTTLAPMTSTASPTSTPQAPPSTSTQPSSTVAPTSSATVTKTAAPSTTPMPSTTAPLTTKAAPSTIAAPSTTTAPSTTPQSTTTTAPTTSKNCNGCFALAGGSCVNNASTGSPTCAPSTGLPCPGAATYCSITSQMNGPPTIIESVGTIQELYGTNLAQINAQCDGQGRCDAGLGSTALQCQDNNGEPRSNCGGQGDTQFVVACLNDPSPGIRNPVGVLFRNTPTTNPCTTDSDCLAQGPEYGCASVSGGQYCTPLAPVTIGCATTAACFPADATVRLLDGATRQMKDIRVGDKVATLSQTGKISYEPIFMMGHADTDKIANFVTVHHRGQDGSTGTMQLTPNHLIATGSSCTTYTMILAGDLHVGMRVLSVSQDATCTTHVITELQINKKRGVYAPFSMSGVIVVDDVVASTYAVYDGSSLYNAARAMGIPRQMILHVALMPLRIMYHFQGPKSATWCTCADCTISKVHESCYSSLIVALCVFIGAGSFSRYMIDMKY